MECDIKFPEIKQTQGFKEHFPLLAALDSVSSHSSTGLVERPKG